MAEARPSTLGAALVAGVLFGFGLALSTMVRPEIVIEFLRFRDLGLLLVLGGAVVVATIVYQAAPRLLARPLFGGAFELRRDEAHPAVDQLPHRLPLGLRATGGVVDLERCD